MSLDLRARAAVAALELFGFNPGQKRGPDGRFIKMGGAGSAGGRRNKRRGSAPDSGYGRRRADLERSVATGVVAEHKLGSGAMGQTSRIELADGTRAIRKKAVLDWEFSQDHPSVTPQHQTDAEELSALVAQAVGLDAPAVSRTGPDEIDMEYVEGQTGNVLGVKSGVLREHKASTDGIRVGLLDTLIANADRHFGNYLVDDQGRLRPIDHGLSFIQTQRIRRDGGLEPTPADEHNVVSPFATQHFGIAGGSGFRGENPLTTADVQKLRPRLEALRPEFDRLGRADWHQSMLARFEQLAERATGTQEVLP